jgi:ribosomal protein S18 acetylase RimI-like enzyme
VLRLVEADLAAARDPEACRQAPSLVRDRRDELHSPGFEFRDALLDVVTHQKELVILYLSTPAWSRMDAELGGWQSENQPAFAVIDPIEAEQVPEELSRGLGILGINQRVDAADHRRNIREPALTIRELTEADLPFLRRMLYAALFWRRRRWWLPERLLLRYPAVAMYHHDWGRLGDVGFLAEEDGERVGAVWYRFFTEEEHGDGYVDSETPELAIAVAEGHRGRGIGRQLMEAIHERARQDGVRRIALSVDADNPARHLYRSLGYRDYEPADPKGRMILDVTA